MGQSIGELFVKLGFDVDDKKLKSFDDSLKGVFNNVVKFAGVTAAGIGFYEMGKNALDTAQKVANLTSAFGASTKEIRGWAAAFHESNPAITYAQGIEQYGKVLQYFNNAAFTGTGAAALNRLGITFKPEDIQHPGNRLERLFDRIPELLAEHPNNRGLYSTLIGQLTGNPADIRLFEQGRGFFNAASDRGQIYEDEQKKLEATNRAISELTDTWNTFISHILATISPAAQDVLNTADKNGIFSKATVEAIGRNSPLPLWITNWGIIDNIAIGAKKISDTIDDDWRKDSRSFWEAHGLDIDHQAAFIAQEQAESGGNPRAKNGNFQGLFQWSPERVAEILKGTGIDINTAGHWQQLQAAEWELRKMGLEDKFLKTPDAGSASEFLSKNFERHEKYNAAHGDETAYRANIANGLVGGMKIEVHQEIHTNADAAEVARIANKGMSDAITSAYIQRTGVNP